jgi:RNA polymerase sigma-70 factor (ECF subfamily)
MEVAPQEGGRLPGRRAALGSKEIEDWILGVAPDAIAYAASLLRDRGAAEDVVQDCFCRLLQKADIYDLPRDGRKLLFRSVTNACFNRNSRERPVLSLQGGDDEPAREVHDRAAQSPESILMLRELENAVAGGLAELPVLHRAALELKALGHSLQEIAQMLDVSVSHAGVLVHRARRALAKHLAPYVEGQVG